MISRAILARRLPLAASASNCVSRIRTNASSAATKKPLNTTNARTARIFRRLSAKAFQFMSQTPLAEDELENSGQGDNSDFSLVAAEHDGETLAAALHALQRGLKP